MFDDKHKKLHYLNGRYCTNGTQKIPSPSKTWLQRWSHGRKRDIWIQTFGPIFSPRSTPLSWWPVFPYWSYQLRPKDQILSYVFLCSIFWQHKQSRFFQSSCLIRCLIDFHAIHYFVILCPSFVWITKQELYWFKSIKKKTCQSTAWIISE